MVAEKGSEMRNQRGTTWRNLLVQEMDKHGESLAPLLHAVVAWEGAELSNVQGRVIWDER